MSLYVPVAVYEPRLYEPVAVPPVGQTGYINISPGTAPPICCSGKALGLRNHPNILITCAIVSALVFADLLAPMPAPRCR